MQLLNEANIDQLRQYTRDTALTIPNVGYGVLLMVDRCVNAFPELVRIPINGNPILFVPKEISVYNKRVPTNNAIIDSANKTRFGVESDISKVRNSFITDISGAMSFLKNQVSNERFIGEGVKFIANTASQLMSATKMKDWTLIYVLDDKFVGNDKLTDADLFGECIMRTIANKGTFGEIDRIILCNNGALWQIYSRNVETDLAKVAEIIDGIRPNTFAYLRPQKEQQKAQPVQRVKESAGQEEIADFDKLAQMLKSNSSNTNIEQSAHIEQKITGAISKKLEQEQFDGNRKIPMVSGDNEQAFSKAIDPNNEKMFPFLTSTKVENDSITDNKRTDVLEDRDAMERVIVNQLVSMSNGDERTKRDLRDKLESKLSQNPALLSKAIGAFTAKDFKSLITYVNEDRLPYASRIYPKKEEVDRAVLSELDNWSEERGYSQAVSSDPVLTSSIISGTVVSNMHRVMAQKQLTWNTMPQEIERYITKLLEDNDFQLVDISMSDKEPPITQIEPTYKSEIKIRVRNKLTRNVQTLVFEVPTLIDGKIIFAA